MQETVRGVVKINRRAQIENDDGKLILIPYPLDAPVSKPELEWMGRQLFAYLKDKHVEVRGVREGNRLFGAHVVMRARKVRDVPIAPESRDRFAGEFEEHFKKKSKYIARKLNAAGIVTISAFYHRVENSREVEIPAFAKYLKVSPRMIKDFLRALEGDQNKSLVAASLKFPVTRGVNLQHVNRVSGSRRKSRARATPPKFPDSGATPRLPLKINLTQKVTSIKDQGPFRGTCVAHAGVTMLEFEVINQGTSNRKLDLSEQHLYWGCKQIDGAPDEEGSFIEYAVEVMKNGVKSRNMPAGVCKEKDWPYVVKPIGGNESHDPPPRKVAKAKKYSVAKYHKIKQNSIAKIKAALADGHAVGLSVYTYHFWTDAYAWREGKISIPIGIKPDGAHAICLVGYEDSDDTHRDGNFLFKNSWGTNWGGARDDPGYGNLPYRYIIGEAIEAWTIEL